MDKLLIRGNHDRRKVVRTLPIGIPILSSAQVHNIFGHKVWMDHYPPEEPLPEDVMALAGHHHNQHPIQEHWIDVGVDAWDYRPVNFNELLNIHRRMN